MAKVKFDPSLQGVSGKVGNYVYRQSRGRTVMSAAPDVVRRKPRPAEALWQQHFRQASDYAVEVLSDPLQRAEYQRLADERGQMVRNLVMGDFMNPPEVTDLILAAYNGKPGDVIKVRARDDLDVVSVGLKITDDASGAVIESGLCVETHGVWVYRTTTALVPGQHVTIEATARDRPGHTGSATKSYP